MLDLPRAAAGNALRILALAAGKARGEIRIFEVLIDPLEISGKVERTLLLVGLLFDLRVRPVPFLQGLQSLPLSFKLVVGLHGLLLRDDDRNFAFIILFFRIHKPGRAVDLAENRHSDPMDGIFE